MTRHRVLVAALAACLLVIGCPPAAIAQPDRAQPYAGKTLSARELAELDASYWSGLGLVKAVATSLAESHGSVGAWHDNLIAGKVVSRDCGLFQINIPAAQIGGSDEAALRTALFEEWVWRPVAAFNVQQAKQLYLQPWRRGSALGVRQFQPWVAYTSGWATFPEWWVWHQDATGTPVGPWLATGRYVQQAIAGVANYRLLGKRDLSRSQALALARGYQVTFKVQGTLGLVDGTIAWTSSPAMPSSPPADGVGPRPRPNDGR